MRFLPWSIFLAVCALCLLVQLTHGAPAKARKGGRGGGKSASAPDPSDNPSLPAVNTPIKSAPDPDEFKSWLSHPRAAPMLEKLPVFYCGKGTDTAAASFIENLEKNGVTIRMIADVWANKIRYSWRKDKWGPISGEYARLVTSRRAYLIYRLPEKKMQNAKRPKPPAVWNQYEWPKLQANKHVEEVFAIELGPDSQIPPRSKWTEIKKSRKGNPLSDPKPTDNSRQDAGKASPPMTQKSMRNPLIKAS